jgi:hypothetical protein
MTDLLGKGFKEIYINEEDLLYGSGAPLMAEKSE